MPSPPLSIVQPLSPRIAILASDDVKLSCEANGCRGMEELLRPWEGGTERVSVLSSTLTPTVHPSFPLRFVSFDSIFPNPAVGAPMPDMVVDMISSYVGDRKPDEEQHYPLARSLLLSSRPLAAYETFNHPVGVLFAISSGDADPLMAMRRLVQQHIGAVQTVPWMDAVNLLKFYVVVHDVGRQGQDMAQANEILMAVKKTYGPHSTLLITNSRPPPTSPPSTPDTRPHPAISLPRPLTSEEDSPGAISQIYASALSSLALSPMSAVAAAMGDVSSSDTPARRNLYGAALSAEDTQRLAALVRELVVQSLLPWMEARVREWNEVYHANRRGITGRLFGAGRKFFGSRPASPAPNASATGYNTAKGYYPIAAVESLTRRLADFAFMLRDYRFASSIYDSLRRDYAQDRALRHSAAATEMYGLSLLLSNPYFLPSTPPRPIALTPFTTLQHTDISSWLEQAVLAYYDAGQGIQLDALRATLLYYEAWKMIGEYRGVGAALVRAAGEAEEVVGAVMIEEAAQADLRGGKDPEGRGRRRRAFHLVMAGRRYETAGLKSYSRRCLTRAAEIYRSTPWTAIKDRIEYSLGRQAYASGEMAGAVRHFLSLLGRDDTGVPGSQGGPLEDMGLAYEQLVSYPEQLDEIKGTLQLPTPVFDVQKTRIVSTANEASGSRSQGRYNELEAIALGEWDRKGKKPMRLLPDQGRTEVNAGDTFHVQLHATNPLNTPLVISDLSVTFSSPTLVSADIQIEHNPEVSLEAYETRLVHISVTVPSPGSVTLDSVSFLFHRFLPVTQPLKKRGKRLHATKAQRIGTEYGTDTSLTAQIVQGGPRIRAELVRDSERVVYEGEEVQLGLRIRNGGRGAVEGLQMVLGEARSLRLRDKVKGVQSLPNRLGGSHTLNLDVASLGPGEEKTINVVFTPRTTGPIDLDVLVLGNSAGEEDEIACTPASLSIDVRPSLAISTRIRPSSDSGGYQVLVDAHNWSDTSIQLNGLHSFSPYWTASPVELESAILLPNQAYRMVIPVHPPKELPANLDLRQMRLVDALSLLIQGKPAGETPIDHPLIALPTAEDGSSIDLGAFLAARQTYRAASLRSSFPTIPSSQLASLFPLIDPLDLDLILSWSIPSSASSDPSSGSRIGKTYIHALRPSPSFSLVGPIHDQIASALAGGSKAKRTMYEETGRLRRVLVDSVLEGGLAAEDDPVDVRMKVKGAARGVLRLEEAEVGATGVEVELRNRSVGIPVRWLLRLPSDLSGSMGQREQAVFTGSLVHSGTLQPNTSEVLRCKVLVPESGMLDLSGWTADVETGDEVEDGWRPRMSWSRVGSGGVVQIIRE